MKRFLVILSVALLAIAALLAFAEDDSFAFESNDLTFQALDVNSAENSNGENSSNNESSSNDENSSNGENSSNNEATTVKAVEMISPAMVAIRTITDPASIMALAPTLNMVLAPPTDTVLVPMLDMALATTLSTILASALAMVLTLTLVPPIMAMPYPCSARAVLATTAALCAQ